MTRVLSSSPESRSASMIRLDALVDREQRLGPAAVAPRGVGDLLGGQRRAGANRRRLVGDVGLVEVRRLREGLVANAPRWRAAGFAVLRSGSGSALGVGPPLWGARYASERKNGRRRAPAGDQLDRLVGVDVGRVRLRRGRGVGILGGRAVGDPLTVFEQLVAVEAVGLASSRATRTSPAGTPTALFS